MKWYNQLQYTAMIAVGVMLPIDWRLGMAALWATLSLAAVSVVKAVAERRLSNPALGRSERTGLWLIVAYIGLYAVGIGFSHDRATALDYFVVKASMLVCPLVVLLSDTSYLTARHKRGLLLSVVAGVLLRIGGCAVYDLLCVARGKAGWGLFLTAGFDPRHHAYSALYAVVAVAVLLAWCFGGVRRPRRRLWQAGAAMALMAIYVLVVDSRVGNIALGGVGLCTAGWVALMRRRWMQGAVLAVAFGAVLVGGPVAIHGSSRLFLTMEDLVGDETDARIKITRSAIELYRQSPLLGHSSGDYQSGLRSTYERNGFGLGARSNFSSHNQYMESLLAFGPLCLLMLTGVVLWPLVAAWRRRRGRLLTLMLVYVLAVNLLFEAMLERQMGLQFYAFVYMTIYLITSHKKNKFGRFAK